MATPAKGTRERGKPQGDEEAGTELNLGEFEGVDTMNYSEAALIIQAIVDKRRKTQKVVNDTE
jgi:DNA-directed RNA polymerase II subunit RPB4